jgi:hypothetical protein
MRVGLAILTALLIVGSSYVALILLPALLGWGLLGTPLTPLRGFFVILLVATPFISMVLGALPTGVFNSDWRPKLVREAIMIGAPLISVTLLAWAVATS